MIHVHDAIWKERGQLTTQGSPIKYGDQILRLLEAVHFPPEVSVSHIKGHKKGGMEVAQGNQAADQTAKRAAFQNHDLIGVATLVPQANLPGTPSYTEGETLKAKSESLQEDHMRCSKMHATTNTRNKALQKLLEMSFRGTGLQTTTKQVVSSCPTCQLNHPQGAQRPQWAQQHGTYPGEDWQMDFTQMSVSKEYKYLLVMTDTFTEWNENFPTWSEKAKQMVNKTKQKKQTNRHTKKVP